MASDSNNNWIADTVGDFIHSSIWIAPINTFIDARCATFDYADDDAIEEDDGTPASLDEQMNIYHQYQRLVDSLINSLGKDLDLDQDELTRVCQIPTPVDDSILADESYEQLYSARSFQLFQDMMKRKNLILQLQALVSLQLQWGLLKQSDTGDDLVLSLLLQATGSSSSRRGSTNPMGEPFKIPVLKQQSPQEKEDKHNQQIDDDDDDDVIVVPQKQSISSSRKNKERTEPKKPAKEEYRLPDLRRKGGSDLDAGWHRELQRHDSKEDDDEDSPERNQPKKASTPQTIGAIPEQVLRDKLRELTDRTKASVDDETATAIKSRQNFLQQQRNLIVDKQRAERSRDLEQETYNSRPQSAAHVARKAMTTATTNKTNENKQDDQQQTNISKDEINKRRAVLDRLKREVVDKR